MSPSNSSSSPETDQRLNDIVVAVQEKSTMTNPKQVSPREVVPEVNNPTQGSPQEVVPEVHNPTQVSPQEIVPEVNNPKQVSPHPEVVPEVNNPKQVSPHQEVVPEVNNQKQASPQEVVHEMNNPKQVSPGEVVSQVNNPKQVSPQEVVPDPNNQKQGLPQEVVPETESKKTQRASFELRVLRAINKLIKKYPSLDNHSLICNICKRGFPNANSLGAHQKTHKHDLELERKLKQAEPIYSPPGPGQCFWKKHDNSYQGSCSNNNNNNSSSQGAISLELSLGPSKWMGGGNNNSSVYPSLNGGVTGGGSMDLNTPVRPLVSRNHFYSNYPLDSFTSNVPPPPPPSPATSLSNDENVPGSSLISKEKNKAMVVDDDEKDNWETGGHDADKPAQV
ncbi:GATA zinc finger domain-containing protein 10-like isoform X2 [Brassica rapa]|uniref:GATA zinc finger domain-containing protein 10-like isoform X2 n=1 Tax=Brassica campestris TaxID=3711 RepID=UPI00142E4CAB|nr:GATA zinc finger domain-containing protein 10-like isoform X2 [Brassica rapa]